MTKEADRLVPKWMTVDRAAAALDVTPSALRRRLERAATKGADGATVARFEGIVGRKLGRRWRVALGPDWTMLTDDLQSPGLRGARSAKKGAP